MKVFISWSGSPSKEIGEVLNKYIPDIIQEAETFYSPDSINKGEQWAEAINGELNSSNFGILCITKNNFRSDWINYEAGALTKPVEKAKICPLLFDLQPSDITHSPLTMYQMTMISKDDMLKFFQSMNASCEKTLDKERLNRAFEKYWGDIDKELNKIRQNFKSKEKIQPVAKLNDMTREILDIVRLQNSSTKDSNKEYDELLDAKINTFKQNDVKHLQDLFNSFMQKYDDMLEIKLKIFGNQNKNMLETNLSSFKKEFEEMLETNLNSSNIKNYKMLIDALEVFKVQNENMLAINLNFFKKEFEEMLETKLDTFMLKDSHKIDKNTLKSESDYVIESILETNLSFFRREFEEMLVRNLNFSNVKNYKMLTDTLEVFKIKNENMLAINLNSFKKEFEEMLETKLDTFMLKDSHKIDKNTLKSESDYVIDISSFNKIGFRTRYITLSSILIITENTSLSLYRFINQLKEYGPYHGSEIHSNNIDIVEIKLKALRSINMYIHKSDIKDMASRCNIRIKDIGYKL